MDKIIKRDGQTVDFDRSKISEAIWKAAQSVGGEDKSVAEQISREIEAILSVIFTKDQHPNVEQIQDIVEKMLIERGHAKTAKSYILYRARRAEERQIEKLIFEDSVLPPIAIHETRGKHKSSEINLPPIEINEVNTEKREHTPIKSRNSESTVCPDCNGILISTKAEVSCTSCAYKLEKVVQ